MNENRSKRREWIKTAAIIFLSVMLVLTFFSQTIMNHSLPEVATKYVESGSITTKIRGSGVIESGDPYVVEVPGNYVGRKVSGIQVKVGDKVNKGDILMYLAEGDGNELGAAREALEEAEKAIAEAQDAYDSYILDSNVTSEDLSSANTGISAEALRQQISVLQAQMQEKKDQMAPLETAIAQLEQAIEDCNTQIGYEEEKSRLADSTLDTAKKAMNLAADKQTKAKTARDNAEAARDGIKKELNQLEQDIADGQIPEKEGKKKKKELEEKLEAAEQTLNQKEEALKDANAALKTATREYNAAVKVKNELDASQNINNLNKLKAEYDLSLYNYNKSLKALNEEVEAADKKISDLVGSSSVVKKLRELQDEIESARKAYNEQKKKVEELEGENSENSVTADIGGTITTINVTSGKQISNQDVMVMQPEGQGYFMSFSVTSEQAKTVSVGDKASIVNSWWYNDMDIVLKSIKPDKTDPAKRKTLTFSVDGEVTDGQSISVSVGQKSQNYDLVVPNSAIKEDNNGKFILIVESRNSPVGNRYIATRVDVQVLASDDTKSAISGALQGWEYVITTSTKPLNPGDQVRMTDN